MRLAILSDIHSNLEAFQAVLDDLEIRTTDGIYFLGDLVGYGANPNECCELAEMCDMKGILGNHDRAVLDSRKLPRFNMHARQAVEWTQEQLTDRSRSLLSGWPVSMRRESLVFVHGALTGNDHYFLNSSDIPANLDILKTQHEGSRILFFGHTHIKCFFSDSDPVNKSLVDIPAPLSPDRYYFINPGSVGQPRDGSPNAAYGILDTDTMHYTQYSIPYDTESAQKKIIAAGLSRFLAERLGRGI